MKSNGAHNSGGAIRPNSGTAHWLRADADCPPLFEVSLDSKYRVAPSVREKPRPGTPAAALPYVPHGALGNTCRAGAGKSRFAVYVRQNRAETESIKGHSGFSLVVERAARSFGKSKGNP